jgi:hypothetical protein
MFEGWDGLIGVTVGGFITYWVQSARIRADFSLAAARVQDQDLREFQEAVMALVESLEVDFATFVNISGQLGIQALGAWTPVQTYTALTRADILATRVGISEIKNEWRAIRELVRRNYMLLTLFKGELLLSNKTLNLGDPRYNEWSEDSQKVRRGIERFNEQADRAFGILVSQEQRETWLARVAARVRSRLKGSSSKPS